MERNRRRERRSTAWAGGWLALALLASAVPAHAQQTGGIRGRVTDANSREPVNGAVITARSPSLQGEEFAVSDGSGRFEFQLLPPGSYELRFESPAHQVQVIQDVRVEIGRNTPVSLDLAPTELQVEEIEIVDAAPTVDRGATDTRAAFDEEFIQQTPNPRRFTDVLEQAPGASSDQLGVTVMGSTSVENSYVIDGVNATDVADGRAGTEMNTDFFEVLEVQTAGYLPEYGRSTGGIFNLVIKDGGNDFHGSVFANFSPGILRADAVGITRAGEAIARRDDLILNADLGFTIGGPIVKDKLWFFAGFNPTFSISDVHRDISRRVDRDGDGEADLDENGDPVLERVGTQTYDRNVTTYMFAGKLTWALDPNNRVRLTYFGDPAKVKGVLSPTGDLNGSEDNFLAGRQVGSQNIALNYQSQLFDGAFQIEVLGGVHLRRDEVDRNDTPMTVYEFPNALEDLEPGTICMENDATTFIDCQVQNYRAGGRGAYWDDNFNRYSAGLRFTNLFAGHRLRYGADFEIREFASTRGYSGGYFDRFRGRDNYTSNLRRYYGSEDENSPENTLLYDTNGNPPFSADVKTRAYAAFVQDQWEINDYVTVNGGLRWDMEQFLNAAGDTAFSIEDMFAPRLGLAVDPTGTGAMRVFANWGYFYESIPLTINQRAFSREGFAFQYVTDDGEPICISDETGEPAMPGEDCHEILQLSGGGDAPVVNDLKGQYHEEVVVGGEYALAPNWSIGLTGVARWLKRGIEDISADEGNTYVIANPGVNDCDVGPDQRESLNEVCSPEGEYDTGHTVFRRPKRRHLALIMTLRKQMSDHYQMLASYTLSRTEGNYPGLFSQDSGQLDPNLSAQYDLPDLLINRFGNLPTDRTHVIKLAGSYDFGGIVPAMSGFSVGAFYYGRSGIPISFLGAHESYGQSEVFLLRRGSAGRTPFLHTIDVTANYTIPLGGEKTLNFNATIFNLFNFQKAVRVDQDYTYEAFGRPPNLGASNIEDLDLDPTLFNPSFKTAVERQAPLSVRLGARMTF